MTDRAVPREDPHPGAAFQRAARAEDELSRRGIRPIRRLLVANRSEIAIRVFRAANELGIRTIGVYSAEDRLALHRYKCDEAYLLGRERGPVGAYLAMDEIVALALEKRADAVHPGYGFLSENPDFAEKVTAAGLIWIGPPPAVMRKVSSKVTARALARSLGIPVVPGSEGPVGSLDDALVFAAAAGFPVMVKAARGGGGRGIRVAEDERALREVYPLARKEAAAAFGSDEVFLERRLLAPKHLEVQVLGDRHGGLVHLFERDCSVQRRHQKVVEVAPSGLPAEERARLCDHAVRFARAAGYENAGTVEFLRDRSGETFLIEMNARIQVEHTVTEAVTGVDLVQAQIRVAEGYRIGDDDARLPRQEGVRLAGAAVQCRITTENPLRGFAPDYGRITTFREAAGMGVRLDAGTAFVGAVIVPYYDSLLVKVTAHGRDLVEAAARAHRALDEFRVRGVATNGRFLMNVLGHPTFLAGACDTGFIEANPDLFSWREPRDRATRLLAFLGDVTVNGNPIVPEGARPPEGARVPAAPRLTPEERKARGFPSGTRAVLGREGPAGLARWAREQKRLLVTDTTFRDAHQSLLATRMRTFDMVAVADVYARKLPQLFSLEMWGGATFDAALRFLSEDPWARIAELRSRIPNILFQMLVRGGSAVGYASYPDDLVRAFIREAAVAGIDVFRIFDSLNWVPGMDVAIEAALESGKVCEAAICYTADLHDARRPKYDLAYYVSLAKELARRGVHFLAVKDMAGLCKPYAAAALVEALREETGLPVHFHTHDTAGGQAAAIVKAAEAGADVVDLAIGSMSGLTSQPSMNALVAAMQDAGERATGLDLETLNRVSSYFEDVRRLYRPFESDMRAGDAEVYAHEMPGGQVTNLRAQARSLGLEHRFDDVKRLYRDVNFLLGDIVKVTPSSKVVGDMALFLASNGLEAADVLARGRHLSFPESVVQLLEGRIGLPPGGFDPALVDVVLKGRAPLTERAGKSLPPVDLDALEADLRARYGPEADRKDALSAALFGKVFDDFAAARARWGDVSKVPTRSFLYGMAVDEEILVDIEPGKTLIVKLVSVGEPQEDGTRKVYFELNGSPREVVVRDRRAKATRPARRKADPANPRQVGAGMPGLVAELRCGLGVEVRAGEPLLVLEAMKMQVNVAAPIAGVVRALGVAKGDVVDAGDLLVELG
jgi:pyruvate carboxylase